MVTELISAKAYVNAEDILGRTPLYFAIESKHLATMKLLIIAGANLWHKDPRYEYSKILQGYPMHLQFLREFRQVRVA